MLASFVECMMLQWHNEKKKYSYTFIECNLVKLHTCHGGISSRLCLKHVLT